MVEIVHRIPKGSDLEYAEMDANLTRRVVSISADYLVSSIDNRDVLEYAGAGGHTVTLPDLSTLVASVDSGDFIVTIRNRSANLLTVSVTGLNTINQYASDIIIPKGYVVTLRNSTTVDEWIIVSSHKNNLFSVMASATSAQTISTGTPTPLAYPVHFYDPNSDFHNIAVNNSRITIPACVVVGRFVAAVHWDASNVGERNIYLRRDGSVVNLPGMMGDDTHVDANVSLWQGFATPLMSVTPGSYYEVVVEQNTGGNLDVLRSWFSFEPDIMPL